MCWVILVSSTYPKTLYFPCYFMNWFHQSVVVVLTYGDLYVFNDIKKT